MTSDRIGADSADSGDGRREPIPTLNVRASATIDAVPDEAHVTFELTAEGRSSSAALDAVRQRLSDVNELCDRQGIAATDRVSTASVSEHGERDGGRWLSKGYRAEAFMKVVVRDAEVVGPLVNDVVVAAGPAVRGPFWRVSPDHPARLEACGKAATQARAKAEAYASSLGVELGEILAVTEPGLDTEPQNRGVGQPMAAAVGTRRRSAPEPTPAMDLHPGTQEIQADVEVLFRLQQ